MEERLQTLCPIPIEIVWHENRRIYLSCRRERGRLFLRLHRLFYNAPTPVLEALIRYSLKKDPSSRIVIKQMAHLYFSQNQTAAKPLKTAGHVYDLQEIFNRMQLLVPLKDVSIGWSKRVSRGAFQSMTFGTFDPHLRQIRINPLLDHLEVPLYFLEFIVYHEMLHAICPSKIGSSGRCSIHTREFKEKERQFPHFQAAKEWQKISLKFFKKRKSHGRS